MRAPRWAQQQLLFIRKAGRALAGSLTTGGGPLTRAYGPAPPALHGLSATAAHHATAARTRNFATRIGGIPAAAPGAANRPPPSPPRGANMLQRRSSGCSSEPAAACSATQRPAIPAMHHPSSRRLLHMRPSATAHRHHPHALASSPPLPLGGVGHHGRRWWAAAVPALGVLRPAPPAAAATMASVASAARAAAGKADASEGLQAPEEAETYWREVLDGMKRRESDSQFQRMRALMDVKHPVGISLPKAKEMGATMSCYDVFVRWKQAYPLSVILVQVGDFYETIGIDALVMIYELDFRASAGHTGVPKAGAPKGQLASVVKDLNLRGYSVAMVAEREPEAGASNTKGRTKDRYLLGTSTPANPSYFPSASGASDTSNELFSLQKPVVGIAWSRSGFQAHVLHVELRKVQCTSAMTWEAVQALLAARGAAALLLHSSLDNQRQSYRNALSAIGREHVGMVQTYAGDPTQGFIARVRESGHFKDRDGALDVVWSTFKEDGRPQPLPKSTVTQLGLEGDVGVRSLQAMVLPTGSTLCQQWMRQLLLLPPPPAMAGHVHGVVQHLCDSNAQTPQLNASLPGSKVTEVLSSRRGDAAFFRELHGMVRGVVQLLDDPGHADAWAHLLPYTLWLDMRSPDEEDVGRLRERLARISAAIESVVDLQGPPDLNPGGSGSPSRSPEDEEEDAGSGQQLYPSREAFLRQQATASKNRASELEIQSFARANEKFRYNVTRAQLGRQEDEVDRTLRALTAQLQAFLEPLQAKVNNTKASSMPSIRNLEGNRLVVHVPRHAFIGGPKGVQSVESGAVNLPEVKGGAECWTTRHINDKQLEYLRACKEAQDTVDRLLEQLCVELLPSLKELLLACRCSVVFSALTHHVAAVSKAGWTVPELTDLTRHLPPSSSHAHHHHHNGNGNGNGRHAYSNGNGNGNGVAHATAGPAAGQQPGKLPCMRMELEGYWPYWMQPYAPTVCNDVVLDRMVLLTGPNMAGKSTVLRSVCAVALLANCGLLVPARRVRVPFYDAFLLRNFSGDSPVEGMSSFALEMQEVHIADQQCTERSLVLLDEMSKGTEVGKGSALAGAVLIDWCQRGFTGIFASHLHCLVLCMPQVGITRDHRLEDQGLLDYKCMGLTDGDQLGRGRRGTWHLLDGVCFESLAFEVARQQGMRDGLIRKAEQLYRGIQQGRYPLTGALAAAAPAGGWPAEAPPEPPAARGEGDARGDGEAAEDGEEGEGEEGSPGAEERSPSPSASAAAGGGVGGQPAAGTQEEASPEPGPPAKTLQDAAVVLHTVLAAHLPGSFRAGAAGETAQLPDGLFMSADGRSPPPRHTKRAALYVVQWGNGQFYAGQTDCILSRVVDHRRPVPKYPRNHQQRNRGPDTNVVYALMPEDAPEAAKEAEPLLIATLLELGFPLTSAHDKTKRRQQRKPRGGDL